MKPPADVILVRLRYGPNLHPDHPHTILRAADEKYSSDLKHERSYPWFQRIIGLERQKMPDTKLRFYEARIASSLKELFTVDDQIIANMDIVIGNGVTHFLLHGHSAKIIGAAEMPIAVCPCCFGKQFEHVAREVIAMAHTRKNFI